jgi:hypothetical protein
MWRKNDLVNSLIGGLGRITDIQGSLIAVKLVDGTSLWHYAHELQTPMCVATCDGIEYVCQILEIYEDCYDVLWNNNAYEVQDITRVGDWNEFSPDMAKSDFVRVQIAIAA